MKTLLELEKENIRVAVQLGIISGRQGLRLLEERYAEDAGDRG